MIEAASHLPGESNGTTGKVPVTPATRVKITYQAGMCKGMNSVRSYVPVTSCQSVWSRRSLNEKARKSGKYP